MGPEGKRSVCPENSRDMKKIQFSKMEMLGLLSLAVLLTSQVLYKSIQNQRMNAWVHRDSLSIDFPEGLRDQSDAIEYHSKSSFKKADRKYELFHFDPNTLSQDSLQLLGLPIYAAKNLIAYREKGGQIRVKNDLKKIYGMVDSIFNRLEPYIQIRQQIDLSNKVKTKLKNNVSFSPAPFAKKERFQGRVPLNAADSTLLDSLPGIGPVLSRRIINYRKALGGFNNPTQLLEVYGITDSTFQKIKGYIELQNQEIQRIRINEIDFKTLLKHPYCNFNMTKKIMNYRKQHGPFRTASDMKNIYGVDPVALDRLMPYIDFQARLQEAELAPDL